MANNNKIRFGLRNVFYAKMIDDNTYDRPVPINGAVSLTLKYNGSSATIYADDSPYADMSINNGYTGTLEMVMIPEQFKIDILNFDHDNNGSLVESSDQKTNYFALMFEVQGDKNTTRHVLYRCKAAVPDEEFNTQEEKAKNTNTKLTFSAYPSLGSGWLSHKIHCAAHSFQANYGTWFNGVYIGTAVLGKLAIKSIASITAGETNVTYDALQNSADSVMYKFNATEFLPNVGDVCDTTAGYTAFDGSPLTVPDLGDYITIVEVDSTNKAVAAGCTNVTVTPKSDSE